VRLWRPDGAERGWGGPGDVDAAAPGLRCWRGDSHGPGDLRNVGQDLRNIRGDLRNIREDLRNIREGLRNIAVPVVKASAVWPGLGTTTCCEHDKTKPLLRVAEEGLVVSSIEWR
jgi:hypothetical protein